MLVPIRPCRALVRPFHSSSRMHNLVAPPDPVSHMRPIIYSDAPPPPAPSYLRHPYSLDEFSPQERGEDLALQFKLQRQQLDDFHQHFWFDVRGSLLLMKPSKSSRMQSNTRFEAAKEAVLAGLPPAAPPLAKERALSEFYTHWYMQEAERTDAYTREWRARNSALIKLSARVQIHQFANAVADFFTPKK
ncbi:hypothetical protein C0993_009974 [Termitomyces sp. T159_Od127]|nr:hypothetical protein C0993_009974 [Termitomyces sp. T159_Od127]